MDDDDGLVRLSVLGVERLAALELARERARNGGGVLARRRHDPRPRRARARSLDELGSHDHDLVALGEVLERLEPHADAQPRPADLMLEAAVDLQPRGRQLVARVGADDGADEDPWTGLLGAQGR